jgi:hypothetical protein
MHCLGTLETLQQRIDQEPLLEKIITSDARRFIRENCKWMQEPCPYWLVQELQIQARFPKVITGIVASYMYGSIETQSKDIICGIDHDDDNALTIFLENFIIMTKTTTFANQKMVAETPLRNLLVSFCVYSIMLEFNKKDVECGMLGSIIRLSMWALGMKVCCSHLTVVRSLNAGPIRDIIDKKILLDDLINIHGIRDFHPNEILHFIERTKESDNYVFPEILSFVKSPSIEKFPDMHLLEQKIQEKIKTCSIAIEKHIKFVQLFALYGIMDTLYANKTQIKYPKLVCSFCGINAYAICSCKTVRYCSKECQRANYRLHKKYCLPHH